MSDDKIVHFEELYEQSESVATKVYHDTECEHLVKMITELLNAYKDQDLAEIPNEVKHSLKKRTLGEVLFIITALSAKDNINVYLALKEQVFLNELSIKKQ